MLKIALLVFGLLWPALPVEGGWPKLPPEKPKTKTIQVVKRPGYWEQAVACPNCPKTWVPPVVEAVRVLVDDQGNPAPPGATPSEELGRGASSSDARQGQGWRLGKRIKERRGR